jgi:hypothetical protein
MAHFTVHTVTDSQCRRDAESRSVKFLKHYSPPPLSSLGFCHALLNIPLTCLCPIVKFSPDIQYNLPQFTAANKFHTRMLASGFPPKYLPDLAHHQFFFLAVFTLNINSQ